MLRLTLYLGAAPIGLATGLLAWMAAGGAAAGFEKLVPIEQGLTAIRPPPRMNVQVGFVSLPDMVAAPLFALATGPGAVAEAVIRVEGVALTARRTAALISIDGKAADWMRVGETRDGVTLQQVTPGKIVVDTAFGPKDVALGERSAGAPEPSAPAIQASRTDEMPPGFRGPPPPASAPRSQ